MAKNSKAKIPNPALKPFKKLIGEWGTVGKHPMMGDKSLNGKSSFNWIEGGAFVIWHSEMDDKHFPAGISIFGSDDVTGGLIMLHFDERKVSRICNVSFKKNVLKYWRITPDFSQRYTWTITKNTIISKGKLSEDSKTWNKDLDQTFSRIRKK